MMLIIDMTLITFLKSRQVENLTMIVDTSICLFGVLWTYYLLDNPRTDNVEHF